MNIATSSIPEMTNGLPRPVWLRTSSALVRGFGGPTADDGPMNMHTPADDSDGKSSPEVSPTPCPLTSLTGFKRDQLFVIQRLADQNPHGLVIKTELDRHYDERITQGRLYQNLGELVEEGYVEKHPLDGRTNAYRLSTYAARRLLDQYKWEQQCLQQETE